MEKALRIQAEVQRILGTEEVYLVGGSVRDIVMDNEPKDYDFTTPLTPEEMKVKVKEAGRRVYNIGRGEKHGTVTFKVPYEYYTGYVDPAKDPNHLVVQDIEDREEHTEWIFVEVTTHRTETYDGKSRQPQTTFGVSLDADLARRDFTFNAMVLKGENEIYDPYGGRLDILARLIKSVGLPKDRIQEDPLRILRAARFAARYGFTVDPNFTGKARQLSARILDISRERWVLELDKILMSDFHSVGIHLLEEMGVLKYMLPEISFMLNQHRPIGNEWERDHYTFDMEQAHANPIFFPEDDVDTRWKKWLDHISMPASRKYDEYGYISYENQARISREMKIGICARLKFSNERTKKIIE